jgi:hypothetical protein
MAYEALGLLPGAARRERDRVEDAAGFVFTLSPTPYISPLL